MGNVDSGNWGGCKRMRGWREVDAAMFGWFGAGHASRWCFLYLLLPFSPEKRAYCVESLQPVILVDVSEADTSDMYSTSNSLPLYKT